MITTIDMYTCFRIHSENVCLDCKFRRYQFLRDYGARGLGELGFFFKKIGTNSLDLKFRRIHTLRNFLTLQLFCWKPVYNLTTEHIPTRMKSMQNIFFRG